MKLRNKKTGEIKSLSIYGIDLHIRDEDMPVYHSLKELNEEWEDVPEEPKQHWFMATDGRVLECNELADWSGEKSIGNYFESNEEAEAVVEKLKAFRRLKDKGFKFDGWTIDDGLKISICTNMDSASEDIYEDDKEKLRSDLDTCFGGEE